MYSDVVRRTQIYLDDADAELLTQMSIRTGASRSELIRRAVRAQYSGQTPEGRLAALHVSAGLWSNRSRSGDDYVEQLRGSLDERLAQVGLQ